MPAGERVLVIGATQGTGSLIVPRLLRDGYSVRVLARTPDRARARFGASVDVVAGDVTKPGTLPAAMDGIHHLILTAGVTKRPAPESLVKATEHDGTLNVLAAAERRSFGRAPPALPSEWFARRSLRKSTPLWGDSEKPAQQVKGAAVHA